MVKINNAKSPYHTQRNNRVRPVTSCNTTAYVMFLRANGIELDVPDGVQPEDMLSSILSTEEAYERLAKRHPWAVGRYNPQEIHDMLVWGAARLVGRQVSDFTTRMPIDELAYRVARGEALVVSGRFSGLRHVVTVTGLETEQEDIAMAEGPSDVRVGDVRSLIVDDPYGNPHSGYTDPRGNDIVLPWAEALRCLNDTGSNTHKWAHYLIGDGEHGGREIQQETAEAA